MPLYNREYSMKVILGGRQISEQVVKLKRIRSCNYIFADVNTSEVIVIPHNNFPICSAPSFETTVNVIFEPHGN
jgi:hypothetical protein